MEPVSVIGLGGALLGIIDVLTSSVESLRNLQTRYKITHLRFWSVVGQLSTLKAALSQISEMIKSGPFARPHHQQLEADLKVSLDNCGALISVLDDQLQPSKGEETASLGTRRKIRFLWEEDSMNEFLDLLNNQINAIYILLTAIQCRSLYEQRNLLQSDENRKAVALVKDDTSSLLWLRDAESHASLRSISTRNSVMLDTVFDFDHEIFNSKVYNMAARSNMKRAVLDGKNSWNRHLDISAGGFDVTSDENVQTLRGQAEDSRSWLPLEYSEAQVTSPSAEGVVEQSSAEHHVSPAPDQPENSICVATKIEIKFCRISCFSSRVWADGVIDGSPSEHQRLPVPDEDPKSILVTKEIEVHFFKRLPISHPAVPILYMRENAYQSLTNSSLAKRIGRSAPQTSLVPNVGASVTQKGVGSATPNILILTIRQGRKSTLLESMKCFCGSRFDELDIASHRQIILITLVQKMRDLLIDMMGMISGLGALVSEEHVQTIFELPPTLNTVRLLPEVATAIATILTDPNVQRHLQASYDKSEVGLDVNWQYYFDSMDGMSESITQQRNKKFFGLIVGLRELTKISVKVDSVYTRSLNLAGRDRKEGNG